MYFNLVLNCDPGFFYIGKRVEITVEPVQTDVLQAILLSFTVFFGLKYIFL